MLAGFSLIIPLFSGPPSLLVLSHHHDGQLFTWTIPSQFGTYAAPVAGLTVSGWTVEGGTVVNGSLPANRVVRFYAQGRTGPKLLCLIDVRYFATSQGWQPYYKMDEEMFFTHQNGRWIPLNIVNGIPSIITYTPIGFANAAGYYPGLHFFQTTAPITLTGWQVSHAETSALPTP